MKHEITKTISAELKPFGNTNISDLKIYIDKDENLCGQRQNAIKVLDERHKAFMSNTINAKLDFTTLESLLMQRTHTKKEQNKERKSLCEQLIEFLESQNEAEFEMLAKASTPSKLIKDINRAAGKTIECLAPFANFATYLSDYNTARKNIYAKNNKAGSLGCRIITENFSIFIKNKHKYQKLISEYASIVKDVVDNLPELSDIILKFASTKDYMTFSVQDNIVKYNAIVGEINKNINLYIQQNPDAKKSPKKLHMKKLFKQILFDSESLFVVAPKITKEAELKELINTLWEEIIEHGKVLDEVMELLKNIGKYDLSEIYITKNTAIKLMHWNYNDGPYVRSIAKNITSNIVPISDVVEHIGLETYLQPMSGYKKDALLSYSAIKSFDKIMNNRVAVEHIHCFMNSLNDFRRIAEFITIDKSLLSDDEFYDTYTELKGIMRLVSKVYNTVRNFINQRPKDISKKMKLVFGYADFMNGWDYDKIINNTYGAAMFKKGNRIYIGLKPENDLFKEEIRQIREGEETMQFVKYKQFNPNQQIPRLFHKTEFIDKYTQENPRTNIQQILDKKVADKEYEYTEEESAELIKYYIYCLIDSGYAEMYNIEFSDASKYKNINNFFETIKKSTYKIEFIDIPLSQIEDWIDNKRIFMFYVHTKDYQPGAYGSKELFTMFLEQLFSEDNLKSNIIRLCGASTVMFRKQTIKDPYVHEKGSILLNKRDKDGNPIPSETYLNLRDYLNGKLSKSELSKEEVAYLDRIKYKTAKEDIIKDRRYTEDKMFINLPITINKGCKLEINEFNKAMRQRAKYIISLDRGERNLLYYTVMDFNGNIIEEGSLNIIDGYNYQIKLSQLEKERKDEQRNWHATSQIKHIKNGYVGKAVYKICQLVIKYDGAIIAMESLNKTFCVKRDAAIGPSVYQYFQNALLKKLSYLVMKDRKPTEEGGILNGYQLAYCPNKIEDNPVQYGIVFFVNAGYTSKIDPVTGFTNQFKFDEYNTNEKATEFVKSFDYIRINDNDVAEFKFKYSNFEMFCESNKNKKDKNDEADEVDKYCEREWNCIINGSRIISKKNKETKFWEYHNEDMRVELDKLCENYNISKDHGTDIKSEILRICASKPAICKEFVSLIKKVMQLRNSNRNTGEDYIISPAVDGSGTYDSRNPENAEKSLPINGDSNGSRNIGIKCIMYLNMLKENGEFFVKNEYYFCELKRFSKKQKRRF